MFRHYLWCQQLIYDPKLLVYRTRTFKVISIKYVYFIHRIRYPNCKYMTDVDITQINK